MLKSHVHLRNRWISAGLAAVLAAYLAHTFYFRDYVNDDAYITFRYSRLLAMGHGPYFNDSEHVEGYTNFLLMLLLAPVIALGGEAAAPFVAKTIGVLGGCTTVLMTFVLAKLLDRRTGADASRASVAGLVAAGLVAASPAFALNSMSGLETTLFAACIVTGLVLGVRCGQGRNWLGVGLAFSAAVLTRPEGIFVFAVYWCAQSALMTTNPDALLVDGASGRHDTPSRYGWFRRCWLRVGAVVLVVFAAQLAFRVLMYDGEWLPNTFYAKRGGFWKIDAWGYVCDGVFMPCLGMVGTLLGCLGWVLTDTRRRAVIPIACLAGSASLLPLLVGTDWMLGWRLVMPYLPVVAAVVAVGWCRLTRRFIKKPGWLGTTLVLCSLPVSWFTQAEPRHAFHRRVTLRAKGYANGHTALANWVRHEAARPGDAIALMDIGIVGYLCIEQKILDISGLTDRFIARSPGTFLDKHYDVRYILDRRPEFIVLTMTGSPSTEDASDASLSLRGWTAVERRILRNPDFQRYYVRRPTTKRLPPSNTSWGIARRLGAERVFQHDYPGKYYLLVVFRRLQVGSDVHAARRTQAVRPRLLAQN